MTYHVLARKWRPQTFSDLVGQSHVVKALTFALSRQQVHHAYLFTGTRGVGKTSIARIFAKSLNCEVNGVSPNPCDECESCREIRAGKFVDLIEVDAASRTGVDETRELIDSVSYLPSKGRFKVYLIDEVHMFSKSSFNALLKTLEEPPEHVKFILATTDPEKLPITILSRCLQFNLKSLTQAQIKQHLAGICQAESVPYDNEALTLLAAAGDGSMRDTLSMTDQAIAYGQGELSMRAVSEILGTIQPTDIEAILFAIATNNPVQLNQALHRLDHYEVDARAFLLEIMRRLQQMAWVKEGVVDDLSQTLLSTVNDIPKPLLHLWYDIAEKALSRLGQAGEARVAIEMALLRMLAFTPADWLPRQRTPLDTLTQQKKPPSTQQKKLSSGQDDTLAPTAKATAYPVTPQESLEAAEAAFAAQNPTAESEKGRITESVESVATKKQMKSTQPPVEDSSATPVPQTHLDQAEQEQDAQNKNKQLPEGEERESLNDQAWHLSQEPTNDPPPDFDELKQHLQRGRDITSPAQSAADEKNVTTSTEPADGLDKLADFDWYRVYEQLNLSNYAKHFAGLGVLSLETAENPEAVLQATFSLSPKNEVLYNEDNYQALKTALQSYYNRPIKLQVKMTEIHQETPSDLNKKQQEKQEKETLSTFYQLPMTQRLLQEFDGQIIENTVKIKN